MDDYSYENGRYFKGEQIMCSMKITDVSQVSLLKGDDSKILKKATQLSSNESSAKVSAMKQKIASQDYAIDFNKLAEKIGEKLLTNKE